MLAWAGMQRSGRTDFLVPTFLLSCWLTLGELGGGVEFLERYFSKKTNISESLFCVEGNHAVCSLFLWVAMLFLSRKGLSKISSLAQMYNDYNLSSRLVYFSQHDQ